MGENSSADWLAFILRLTSAHACTQQYTHTQYTTTTCSLKTHGIASDYRQGRPSPPETMMHFPPVSDFPPISEKISDFLNFFTILPFPEKFLDFHPPKYLMTFFQYISPLFRVNYSFPPNFTNSSPLFYANSPAFYILYVYFPPTLTVMHLCITQCT